MDQTLAASGPLAEDWAIEELKSSIKGDLILPSDEYYTEAIKRWSKLAEKPAGAVLYPKEEGDISQAINFAVVHNVDIAIKGTHPYVFNSCTHC